VAAVDPCCGVDGLWFGGHLAAPPVAVNGKLFLASLDGRLRCLDPDDGTVLKEWKTGAPGWTSWFS